MAPLFWEVPRVRPGSWAPTFDGNKPVWLLQMWRECLEMSMTLHSKISAEVFKWGFSARANSETKSESLGSHMRWALIRRMLLLRNQKYCVIWSRWWRQESSKNKNPSLLKTGYSLQENTLTHRRLEEWKRQWHHVSHLSFQALTTNILTAKQPLKFTFINPWGL